MENAEKGTLTREVGGKDGTRMQKEGIIAQTAQPEPTHIKGVLVSGRRHSEVVMTSGNHKY